MPKRNNGMLCFRPPSGKELCREMSLQALTEPTDSAEEPKIVNWANTPLILLRQPNDRIHGLQGNVSLGMAP